LVSPFPRSRKRPNNCGYCRICASVNKTPTKSKSHCKQIPKTQRQLSCRRSVREKSAKKTSFVDHLKKRIAKRKYYSTRKSVNRTDNACCCDSETDSEESFCDCENMPDTQDDRRQLASKTYKTEQHDKFVNSIPGPSNKRRTRTPVSPRNERKKMRLDDRTAKRAKYDEEGIIEEDLDCICNTRIVNPDAYSRKRLSDRIGVATRNPRNSRSFEDVENRKERGMKNNEENEEQEDTNTEDSTYRQLKKRNSRRSGTRKQELKRWIQRCREEYERQKAQ